MSIWQIGALKTNETTPKSIDFSSTGDNTVIAGISGQTIRVWRIFFVLSAATNLTFKNGSISLTGAMSMAANGSFLLDLQGDPWFVTSSGNNFIINQSGTAQVSGTIFYSQS